MIALRVGIAAAAFVLALTPAGVAAATFSREGLCEGFRLVRVGADLVVRCPTAGGFEDWMRVRDLFAVCPTVRAYRKPSGDVVVTCAPRAP